MPQIRLATANDENALLSHLDRLSDQWGLRQSNGDAFPFDAVKAKQTLRRAFSQDGVWIGVVGTPENIEASVGLFVNQPFFSTGSFLAEMWTCVSPDHNGGAVHVERLVAFAKSFADVLGFPLVMGVVARDRVDAKMRLFDRIVGQSPSGNFYVYQPPRFEGTF